MISKNHSHSNGKSVVSRRWKLDIREIVNDYDFSLVGAHGNGGKCDLCGNPLTYVAVIEGNELSGNKSRRHEVGFDCLELVFGRNWKHHSRAKNTIKGLKKQAAIERRKEKNKTDFADIINWFDNLHPDFVNSNRFLKNMKDILESGEKPFTSGMESAVRNWMKRKNYSKSEYQKKLDHFENVTIPKIEKVYNLVCEVDKITPGTDPESTPRWSAYRFVKSVYYQAVHLKKATPAQIGGLESIFSRYMNKKKTMNKGMEEIEKLQSEVPF